MNYKGKILISTPTSSIDIFSRSVILIIDHDEDGAFGLILNKHHNSPIFLGGPVEENIKLCIVRKYDNMPNDFHHINDDFYLTNDIVKVLEDVLDNLSIHYKVFSGYSGWSAHQLEREIDNNLWIVLSDYELDYTEKYDQQLWKDLMEKFGDKYRIWANMPEDISQN